MSRHLRWARSAVVTAAAGTAGYILAAMTGTGGSMPPFLAVLYVIAFGALVGCLVPSLVGELGELRRPTRKPTDKGNPS